MVTGDAAPPKHRCSRTTTRPSSTTRLPGYCVAACTPACPPRKPSPDVSRSRSPLLARTPGSWRMNQQRLD